MLWQYMWACVFQPDSINLKLITVLCAIVSDSIKYSDLAVTIKPISVAITLIIHSTNKCTLHAQVQYCVANVRFGVS